MGLISGNQCGHSCEPNHQIVKPDSFHPITDKLLCHFCKVLHHAIVTFLKETVDIFA